MNLQPGSTIKVASSGTNSKPEIRLQGAWLIIARVAWVVLALLAIGLFVASLPSYYAYLHITNPTSYYGPQLTPGDVRELHSLGLSLDFYAWLNISVFLIFLLVCVSIGVILFLRRSDDHLALLASLSIVFFPLGFNTQIPQTLPSVWMFPIEVLTFCSSVCLGLFIYLFPNGRFVPRWTRWVALGFTVVYVSSCFFPGTIFSFTHWPRLLTLPVPLAWLGTLLCAQLYRYRWVSTLQERQQTKWVVLGASIALLGLLLLAFLPLAVLPLFFPLQRLALLQAVDVDAIAQLVDYRTRRARGVLQQVAAARLQRGEGGRGEAGAPGGCDHARRRRLRGGRVGVRREGRRLRAWRAAAGGRGAWRDP